MEHAEREQSSSFSDQNSLQSTKFPGPTGTSSLQFHQSKHSNMLQQGQQPSRQRLGNLHTERLTREYINYVPVLDPNFPFHYLLLTISAVLLQSIQHPYHLPIIFTNFLQTFLVSLTRSKSLTHMDILFWNTSDIMSKKYGFINYLEANNIAIVLSNETNL